MEPNVSSVTQIAQGISNFGMMVIVAAFFLVLSASLMVACFKWFKSLINNMVQNNSQLMNDLLEETRKQNEQLSDLCEGLRPETQMRIKNLTSAYFDYATEMVCRIIHKVKTENHIVDHEATVRKIRTLLQNMHDDRNSRFDAFSYKGNKLSHYTSSEWIDWVAAVVESEVYADVQNEDRAHTNVETVYKRIKIDFYKNIS